MHGFHVRQIILILPLLGMRVGLELPGPLMIG